MLQCCVIVLLSVSLTIALDNGLGKTPPMGWLTWQRFRCITDCVELPNDCISENLMKQMADIIATEGYKDVGYEYINIDDCWLAHERAADGQLQPDPIRFPSGMKALADYIHKLGLKFGIYEDYGTKTCAGPYPGSKYFMQMDAETFAHWGVDFLKFDGCNAGDWQFKGGYPPMADWLNRTGRPIYYSSGFALHQRVRQIKIDYVELKRVTNLMRNFDDMNDSWMSVLNTINYYGDNDGHFAELAGPGYFNDPDTLIVGGYGLSYDQQRVQMGMWAIMAAPLIISVDIRVIRPESKALLQHKGIIAIDQDPLGIQGTRVMKNNFVQVWKKPILPKGSFAFAFLNVNDEGAPRKVSIKFEALGFTNAKGYNVTEVFDGKHVGNFKPSESFSTYVNPTGIFLGKAVPL